MTAVQSASRIIHSKFFVMLNHIHCYSFTVSDFADTPGQESLFYIYMYRKRDETLASVCRKHQLNISSPQATVAADTSRYP